MKIKNGILKKVLPSEIPEDGKIVISEGVTKIEDYAFSNNSKLTSITIPDGVTSIGICAFSNCIGLTSVTIPDSVTSIGKWAFFNCSGLTSIVIPDSVTSIGDHTFSSCANLTSVTIGNSVKSIEDLTFSLCSRLTSVTIPDSVTKIGDGVFNGCYRMTKISIPGNVKYFGDGVFANIRLRSEYKNYKAFRLQPDGSLYCLNKKYTVGKTSFVKGKLLLCRRGIHFCTNLFEIFNFYSGEYGKDFVIAECKVSKEQKTRKGTSKRCARSIVPERLLSREEVIQILNEGSAQK